MSFPFACSNYRILADKFKGRQGAKVYNKDKKSGRSPTLNHKLRNNPNDSLVPVRFDLRHRGVGLTRTYPPVNAINSGRMRTGENAIGILWIERH